MPDRSGNPSPAGQPDGSRRLALVDADIIFRLGLKTCLGQAVDLQVVVEATTGEELLTRLASLEPQQLPHLIMLAPTSGPDRGGGASDLGFCAQCRDRYPQIPILLLGDRLEADFLAAAFAAGVAGYSPKGVAVADLVHLIQRLLRGQTDWTAAPGMGAMASRSSPNLLRRWQQTLRQSSVQQIEAALAALEAQLQNGNLSVLDRAVLNGRRRELRASRWLVNRLLADRAANFPPSSPTPQPSSALPTPAKRSSDAPLAPRQSALAGAETNPRQIQEALLDRMAAQLRGPLENRTDRPLEIDVLREEKKRDLLYGILRQFEAGLEELRYSQVQPDHIPARCGSLLVTLWQEATTDFFGKYYTLPVGDREYGVVDTLLRDNLVVQSAILTKIPLLPELLAHLLFQAPLVVDNTTCPAGSPAAQARAEALLHNLILRVACAVIQPLLNHFADVETVKLSFYDRRRLSTREIERFRNDLSWHYRLERYIQEPTAIFESQYWLLTLEEDGIGRFAIYAPRNQELAELRGLPYAVTLVLETRDALSPRLRSVLSFVGSGVVYVLTEVIGRGLGLVGRGIAKGVGNVWQETRSGDRPR